MFGFVFRGKDKPKIFLKKIIRESQNIFIIFTLIFLDQELQGGKESGTFPFAPVNLVLWLCNELGPSSAPIRATGESLIAFVAC